MASFKFIGQPSDPEGHTNVWTPRPGLTLTFKKGGKAVEVPEDIAAKLRGNDHFVEVKAETASEPTTEVEVAEEAPKPKGRRKKSV